MHDAQGVRGSSPLRPTVKDLVKVARPVARPSPQVAILGSDDTVRFLCLVETGSLQNQFGIWVADLAGVDVTGAAEQAIGIGGTSFSARTVTATLRSPSSAGRDPCRSANHGRSTSSFLANKVSSAGSPSTSAPPMKHSTSSPTRNSPPPSVPEQVPPDRATAPPPIVGFGRRRRDCRVRYGEVSDPSTTSFPIREPKEGQKKIFGRLSIGAPAGRRGSSPANGAGW